MSRPAPICASAAQVNVDDPATAAERLAAHHDLRTEDEGELTWWGRELTDMEQQCAFAHLRAQFGDEDPVDNPEETPRWLRGRLKRRDDGFEVEVNSEERLGWLLELLDGLGLKPSVARRSAIDPPQDMPPIQLGGPMPSGSSQEAIDAWLAHWADERVPSLGGVRRARPPGTSRCARAWKPYHASSSTTPTNSRGRASRHRTSAGCARLSAWTLWWAERPVSR